MFRGNQKRGSWLYKSKCNQLIIHLKVNSQMYAYLLPFQHDMDIILLPYKKTSPKKSKNIFPSMENNIKKWQKVRPIKIDQVTTVANKKNLYELEELYELM